MENWVERATTDPAVIDDWWHNGYIGSGISVVLGALGIGAQRPRR